MPHSDIKNHDMQSSILFSSVTYLIKIDDLELLLLGICPSTFADSNFFLDNTEL